MATTTTFQIGTYNSLTDTFTSVLDLNDFNTFWIELRSMKMPQPEKVYVRSFNVRTPGENIFKYQYKNRHIQVSVRLKNTSTTTVLSSIRSLLTAIENPPFVLRIQLPNGTKYSYADVVAVKHNIPSDPQALLALVIPSIQIDFECKPGLRGDRVYLQNLVMNPGLEYPGGTALAAFNDSFATVNAYSTIAGSAPTVAANVMTITTGSIAGFGSPAWSCVAPWSIRFKWVTGLTATFYVHYINSTNYMAVVINGSTLVTQYVIAGVTHTLQSVTCTLTTATFYWMQAIQWPQALNALPANAEPQLQATVYNDSTGAIGTQLAAAAATFTTDGTTAVLGKMAIGASGASLAVGGAFSNVHTVSLLGPGAWQRVDSGTGVTSTAWDGSYGLYGMSSNTGVGYPSGPVSSLGTFRVDFPPAGTPSMVFQTYNGGAPAGTAAIPLPTGHTYYASGYVKSSGLSGTATIVLQVLEYNSSGVLQRTTTLQTLTGNQSTWTQVSGNATAGANTAYIAIGVACADTGAGSANGTIWLDNVQAWDSTVTGSTTMSYHEMRHIQSPSQIMVSGILGDMPAPAIFMIGGYFSALNTGHYGYCYVGRRQYATTGIRMATASGSSGTLDTASWGGYKDATNPGALWYSAVNEIGTFHIVTRAQTSNAAPTGVWLAGEQYMQLVATTTFLAQVAPATWQGPEVFPFTAQNTWTICDMGQVILPPSPLSSMVDATQVAGDISSLSGGSGGSGLTANWMAILPTDGELFQCTMLNPSTSGFSSNIATEWVWLYWDGYSPVTAYSLETSPTADVQHSVANYLGTAAAPTSGGIQLIVTPQGDTLPTLDPTSQGSLTVQGVNQYLAIFTDDAADVLAAVVDIIYSPLYLYPR